ncbi:MAG: rsmH [Gammaproteobacteria bacterium]|jgi:16S rRNA (cytosine1402-N4)-methyltransferase|nr:rsmH [Gammaproteobacteria bacterium]
MEHKSVLLTEAIEGLAINTDGIYIDGTFGRGGHSSAILSRLGPNGKLLAIDKDHAAMKIAQEKFGADKRFIFKQGSFAEMHEFAQALFKKPVDGVLLDLGVSSPQLDDPLRGFSFQKDGPLDMRMDQQHGQSAADWLNQAKEEDIAKVLWEYGEERFSRRIAKAITTARASTPFLRTHQLVECIVNAVPRDPHKHPATRSFQAIRIFINRELEDLELGLKAAIESLAIGGRLAVISFHSLEDRIVKQFMNTLAKGDERLRKLPLTDEQLGIRLRLVGKAIKPSSKELAQNVRARSAILRIGEKCR